MYSEYKKCVICNEYDIHIQKYVSNNQSFVPTINFMYTMNCIHIFYMYAIYTASLCQRLMFNPFVPFHFPSFRGSLTLFGVSCFLFPISSLHFHSISGFRLQSILLLLLFRRSLCLECFSIDLDISFLLTYPWQQSAVIIIIISVFFFFLFCKQKRLK